MEVQKTVKEKSFSDITKALMIAVIILPIFMATCVGLYGLAVWFLQIYVIGLPTA